MDEKVELYDNNVEEGPLEETIDSPRFFNLTVEETRDEGGLVNDRSRIVFSPGGDEGYLVTMSDDQRSVGTSDTGPLTDRTRASSPGSNVSTVSTTGRRYLEWDYGSDLGPQYHTQGEAAQSLSQLEKLTISNYTEYLGEGEEKGRKKSKEGAEGFQGDQVAEKFSKFADSLMRQRQLQQQARQSVIKPRPPAVGESSKYTDFNEQERSHRLKSPVKSSSLGSLSESSQLQQQRSNSRCSSSVSCQSLAAAAANSLVSGPSSSSSAGTIIARQDPTKVAGLSAVMRKLSLDMLSDSDNVPEPTSENVSVSTVSTVDENSTGHAPSHHVSAAAAPPDKPKVVWSQDTVNPVSNFRTFEDHTAAAAAEPVLKDRYYRNHSSEPSSVPTTSDEEVERPKQLVGMSDGDTSTMESAQIVDRAKSFEYIPGENFHCQENSSSYEYLPGHLVSDNRPPTVLNTRDDNDERPDTDQVDNGNNDQLQPSLDILSSELREKSKDLMAKNISQTKHFFKKLKGYIEYLSTPSLTLEDSRMKQELAERIMSLLSNEETRLGMSSGLSSTADLSMRSLTFDDKKSGETSTRQLAWKPEQAAAAIGAAYSAAVTAAGAKRSSETRRDKSRDTDFSTMSSELKESDNSSRMSDWKHSKTKSELEYQLKHGQMNSTEAVEIVQKLQRKRIEHMKKLKKEMKKLEKIDSLIVGAAVGKKVPEVSDISIASSVTSVRSEVSISLESGVVSQDKSKASSKMIKATKTRTVTNTNILKVNSDRSSNKVSTERSSKDPQTEEKENNPHQIVMEHISPIVTRSPKRSSKSPVKTQNNFGQVYPSETTDSTNTLTDSNIDTLNSNGTFITKKSPKQRKKAPTKKVQKAKKDVPVAYYLPVDNMSPIRIGTRVLREKNGWVGEQNRNVLSSYMSSLDTQPIRRQSSSSKSSKSNTDLSNNVEAISLQQALINRRQDFVRSCERRVVAMKAAKDARMLRTAKQEQWLEELGRQSPRSQRLAEPCFTPVPIVRVFNHKEMVRATRDKYQELPEVKYAKMDAKKNVRYRGHRLMARIYSSRLQRKVVGRRQVSFNYHQLVV